VTSWFRSIRLGDTLILQAFPILGIFYAERDRVADDLIRVALLLGSLSMLFAHIFAFNDLTDLDADAAHPHKASDTFTRRMSRRSMKALVVALGAASGAGFALLPARTRPFALGLFLASVLYSHPRFAWKRVPLLSSALHLVSGAAHFLIGAVLGGALGAGSLLLAAWCGLVFAAGHLVQEVQDHDADRASGIGTNAVRYGKRRVFVAAFIAFTLSFVYLGALAAAGVIPANLWLLVLAYPPVAYLFVRGWQRGIDVDEVRRIRSGYRILFATVVTILVVGVWRA